MKKAATLSSPKTTSIIGDSLYTYQNLLMVFGLVLSFSGGSWDITFHILNEPESFFSYPHSLVYSGILLVISIFFINFRKNFFRAEKKIRKNNLIILSGIVMILTAGPFDYSWHLKFGLDGLLSPPHLTLLSGWLLIAVGNLRIVNLHLERIRGRPEKVIDHGNGISHSDGVSAGSSVSSDNGSGGKDSGGSGISRDDDKKDGNKVRGDFGTPHERNKLYSKARLYKIQLFLNLSILLMILSGILYFFSLPFSETQSYNFNPPPLLALFVYGLGFPILFSTYFIKILSRYPDMKTMVPLVGTFYVAITLVTQISSNPFLSGYSGYYLLNIVPFGLFYFASRCYYYYRRSNRNSSRSSGKENLKFLNSEKKNFIRFRLPFKYCILGIVFAVLSYSLCFPLNTYVYNEELYGYLIYQNLVVKVYQEIFSENFMIILPMSVAGGCIGYGILLATSSKVRLNHDSH